MNVVSVHVRAMSFTRTHPPVTTFQIEKRSNTLSETLRKDKHLSSPQSNEENWKVGFFLMWPARRGFQLQITETEDKRRVLLREGDQN
jgi:hypothetical protein